LPCFNLYIIPTYTSSDKQGWLPSTPAVFDNIKNYKNGGINAWKSHWTGQLTIQNSLFADNKVDLLYGIKNNGIILKDTRFLALSDDMKERKGESSPNPSAIGIKASYNVFPSATITRAIVLDNVIFESFISDSSTMDLYFDTRRPQCSKFYCTMSLLWITVCTFCVCVCVLSFSLSNIEPMHSFICIHIPPSPFFLSLFYFLHIRLGRHG